MNHETYDKQEIFPQKDKNGNYDRRQMNDHS